MELFCFVPYVTFGTSKTARPPSAANGAPVYIHVHAYMYVYIRLTFWPPCGPALHANVKLAGLHMRTWRPSVVQGAYTVQAKAS